MGPVRARHEPQAQDDDRGVPQPEDAQGEHGGDEPELRLQGPEQSQDPQGEQGGRHRLRPEPSGQVHSARGEYRRSGAGRVGVQEERSRGLRLHEVLQEEIPVIKPGHQALFYILDIL